MIFLFGPTATGKTDLVVQLSEKHRLGIISVDAVQVYRGLDIGAAKPDRSVLAMYPHALINIRDPSEQFSAGDFCTEAWTEIARARNNGETPVLVGGSMFYFSALAKGLAHLPPRNSEVRATIASMRAQLGARQLHALLHKRDPVAASRIHTNDHQRVERALEISLISGQSANPRIRRLGQTKASKLPIVRIGLAFSDRSYLHHRIELRIAKMLSSGVIEEVESLLKTGAGRETSALRSVGYRQICQYLSGEVDYPSMQQRMVWATRQFAKRQLTWMRNTPGTVWFEASDRNLAQTVSNYVSERLN